MADLAALLIQYKRTLRRLRIKRRLLPWTSFQFGARWHRFGSQSLVSAKELTVFEARWGILLPEHYRAFLETVGNGSAGPYYGLSPLAEWSAPDSEENLPADLLRKEFDPGESSASGLAPGALRICNAG